ncbi:MAG: RNA polymerase sigma-I factor [Peptococcaceae bacterium]|nr:RNA polymerase sigma-I factor [Peptococcaceae bacterium]
MDARWDLENNGIAMAQNDALRREAYVADHRTFVFRVTSKFCRRSLNWEQDDELSIALIAFNEAINAYDLTRGVPFLAFARRVMYSRLTDFVRREVKHHTISLDATLESESSAQSVPESQAAWANYSREQADQERAEELLTYQARLQEFGLSLNDLVKVSPKHRDTRENLMRAAIVLCSNPELQRSLLKKRQMPIKELSIASSINLKTLERGRKYIVSVALIIAGGEEFLHLRSYIKFPGQGGVVNG